MIETPRGVLYKPKNYIMKEQLMMFAPAVDAGPGIILFAVGLVVMLIVAKPWQSW